MLLGLMEPFSSWRGPISIFNPMVPRFLLNHDTILTPRLESRATERCASYKSTAGDQRNAFSITNTLNILYVFIFLVVNSRLRGN